MIPASFKDNLPIKVGNQSDVTTLEVTIFSLKSDHNDLYIIIHVHVS